MNNISSTSPQGGLFALMYSSETSATPDEALLNSILERARAKNLKLGITGILLYRQGRYFQYLEGSEEAVKNLYDEICADERHKNVKLLFQTMVEARRFSEWSMGYEKLRASNEPLPAGFRDTFADLEDTENPQNVLRAVTELTLWYRARSARANLSATGSAPATPATPANTDA